jgi:hypothetical protein
MAWSREKKIIPVEEVVDPEPAPHLLTRTTTKKNILTKTMSLMQSVSIRI